MSESRRRRRRDPGIARAIAGLRFDPDAQRAFDGAGGGFVWSDEWSQDLLAACYAAGDDLTYILRYLVAYRAAMIRGEDPNEFADEWSYFEANYPTWPGFRPERRAPELRGELEKCHREFLESFDGSLDPHSGAG